MAQISSAEALLVEHLRYTPLSLIDDVINTINAIVYRAITAVETWMMAASPTSLGFDQPSVPIDANTPANTDDDPEERQRAEIEEGVHRLETLLESTVDKTFDKFEIYTLRNILHVPEGLDKWVRLRHYEGLPLPLPDDAATPDSITRLRRKLQITQQLNLTLSHTHRSNDLLLTQLRSTFLSSDGQLSHLRSAELKRLQPSAQFTKSQLPALKSLLDELRPRLQAISELSDTGAKSGQRGAERDERARYVEAVVDRVVGTQLGTTGEAHSALGGRRAEDEVRAIESIASSRTNKATDRRDIMDDDDPMEE